MRKTANTRLTPTTAKPQLDIVRGAAEQRRARELYEHLASHFWPICGTANYSAYTMMIASIEAEGLLRQRVKQLTNQAMAAVEAMKLNPDMVKYAHGEDKKFFKPAEERTEQCTG